MKVRLWGSALVHETGSDFLTANWSTTGERLSSIELRRTCIIEILGNLKPEWKGRLCVHHRFAEVHIFHSIFDPSFSSYKSRGTIRQTPRKNERKKNLGMINLNGRSLFVCGCVISRRTNYQPNTSFVIHAPGHWLTGDVGGIQSSAQSNRVSILGLRCVVFFRLCILRDKHLIKSINLKSQYLSWRWVLLLRAMIGITAY